MEKLNIKSLEEKNRKVDEVTKRLKEEFFGIDKQIDQVMNTFRTWYLFPQFQDRPIVVNLYGMTGVGKTDLVNKLVKYIGLEKDLVYYNFASIDELKAYDVEDEIEDEIDTKKRNKIFVYDEFQYASTLNEDGCERDNRSGLKPFWELIDSGILNKRMSHSTLSVMGMALSHIAMVDKKCHIVIENGKWINEEECLSHFDPWIISPMADTFNINRKKYCNFKKMIEGEMEEEDNLTDKIHRSWDDDEDIDYWLDHCFLRKNVLENFLRAYNRISKEGIDDAQFYNKIWNMNSNEVVEYLTHIYEEAAKGYKLDFKESIIFVIANLDEAYKLSFNVNPDMSPDQFNKLTQKISVVDVKKALQKRFRNEQIARLGNIHIIYPSFNSETFRKIISTTLDSYCKDLKERLNISLSFDDTIHSIIFKEGVFPTQGTRPIFSSIHEIIKSKLPAIVQHAYDKDLFEKLDNIVLSYNNKNVVVRYEGNDGEVLDELKIKQTFRVEQLRANTKDNNQAIAALHESGHFVVQMALLGEFPEKIVSRSAESGTGGFVLPRVDDDDFSTKKDLYDDIKVSLGGYVAEQLVFGEEDRTTGASADLSSATALAVSMVRRWGICNDIPYVVTKESAKLDNYVADEDQQYINDKVKDIINECLKDVNEILQDPDWRKLLKESALYLSKNNTMKPAVMKRLYNLIPTEKRVVKRDKNFFIGLIENM